MLKKFAISGKMASGKSTIANLFRKRGYLIASIGDAIKEEAMHAIIHPHSLSEKTNKLIEKAKKEGKDEAIEQFVTEYEKLKRGMVGFIKDEQFLFERNGSTYPVGSIAWHNNLKMNYYEFLSGKMIIKNDAYRFILQELANTFRRAFGEDVWLRMLVFELEKWSHIVIDDLRFRSEYELLESLDFTFIRLDITEEEQRKRILALYGEIDESLFTNQTEIDLDEVEFVHRFDNSEQTIEEIEKQLEKTFFATS